MNGARSTYMRKGYLLTALAAAVLLAASSGTAWAQTTVDRRFRRLWRGRHQGRPAVTRSPRAIAPTSP